MNTSMLGFSDMEVFRYFRIFIIVCVPNRLRFSGNW